MISPSDEGYLRDFYRGVLERPFLQPDDPLVVDFHDRLSTQERIANDPIAFLLKDVQWASSDSSLKMLSGFRGSGKTTELLRFRKLLREAGYVVFYINIEDYVEVKQPLDPTSFLISLVGAFEAAAHGKGGDPDDAAGGTMLTDGLGAVWWDKVRDFLGQRVEFTGGTIDLQVAEIEVELRENPEFRSQVRRAVEGSLGAFRQEAHSYVQEIVAAVRRGAAQAEGVVLLVDSLDHADNRSNFEELRNSILELFTGHSALLALPGMHVLYTVPPYLKFLTSGSADVRMLTTIKIAERDGTPFEPGIDALIEMVRRRAPGGDFERLLGSREVLVDLIRSSGGHLRDLLRLLREVCAAPLEALPASAAVIDHARATVRNTLLPLADNEKDWLRRVRDTHDPGLQKDDEWGMLAGLFDRHLILGYVNGEEWYAAHPLVLDLL
jgi:hypothetical protein